MKKDKLFKPYDLMHSQGMISLEKDGKSIIGDLGIQIGHDGKVWICIDGQAFLRFTPDPSGFYSRAKEKITNGES